MARSCRLNLGFPLHRTTHPSVKSPDRWGREAPSVGVSSHPFAKSGWPAFGFLKPFLSLHLHSPLPGREASVLPFRLSLGASSSWRVGVGAGLVFLGMLWYRVGGSVVFFLKHLTGLMLQPPAPHLVFLPLDLTQDEPPTRFYPPTPASRSWVRG